MHLHGLFHLELANFAYAWLSLKSRDLTGLHLPFVVFDQRVAKSALYDPSEGSKYICEALEATSHFSRKAYQGSGPIK